MLFLRKISNIFKILTAFSFISLIGIRIFLKDISKIKLNTRIFFNSSIAFLILTVFSKNVNESFFSINTYKENILRIVPVILIILVVLNRLNLFVTGIIDAISGPTKIESTLFQIINKIGSEGESIKYILTRINGIDIEFHIDDINTLNITSKLNIVLPNENTAYRYNLTQPIKIILHYYKYSKILYKIEL